MGGNIYLGDHETVPGPWSDDYLYKFTPEGSRGLENALGRPIERAVIHTGCGRRTHLHGRAFRRTDKQFSTNSCDMAVVEFDINDGHTIWDFVWHQGYGYEVDGLVIDAEYIYIAGWTTAENTQNDLAVLKLDLNGNLVWKSFWAPRVGTRQTGRLWLIQRTCMWRVDTTA